MRPITINVRLASRTRGHTFIVMLAYIIRELSWRWRKLELTVEEGIKELSTLCIMDIKLNGVLSAGLIPTPRQSIKDLLQAANVRLPDALPVATFNVSTRKKLVKQCKNT